MILEHGQSVKVNRKEGEWGTLHEVKQPRKPWTCRRCNQPIAVGEFHYKQNWHTVPGDVSSYLPTRIHTACYYMGTAVKQAEKLFLTKVALILKEKQGDWALVAEDDPDPHWERIAFPDVLTWVGPTRLDGIPSHLKAIAYNGDTDPTTRYYECTVKPYTIRMMQETKAHLDFVLNHEQPSLEKLFKKKAPVRLADYRKMKQTPTCTGQGEAAHPAASMTLVSAPADESFQYYECGECHRAIDARLVNFN